MKCMGRICIKLDDKYEQNLRRESALSGMSLSELIRRKLVQIDVSDKQDNSAQLEAEILELRKELRIITGAVIKIMEANGLTVEEMKKAGKEFYREHV